MHVTNIKDSRTSRFIGYLVLSCWSAIFIAGYNQYPPPFLSLAITNRVHIPKQRWSFMLEPDLWWLRKSFTCHFVCSKRKKNQVASKCQRMPNLESSVTGWDCKVDLRSAEDFVVGLDCTWSNLQAEKQLTDDVSNDASALYTYTRK
jgi:hypothetical protein